MQKTEGVHEVAVVEGSLAIPREIPSVADAGIVRWLELLILVVILASEESSGRG